MLTCWHCWDRDDPATEHAPWVAVRARVAKDAAVQWLKDNRLTHGPYRVAVRKVAGGPVRVIDVNTEIVVRYRASLNDSGEA